MKGRDFFDDYREFISDVRKLADKAEDKIVTKAAEEVDASEAKPEEVETESVEVETETETEPGKGESDESESE